MMSEGHKENPFKAAEDVPRGNDLYTMDETYLFNMDSAQGLYQ